jgi:hypothetical protein
MSAQSNADTPAFVFESPGDIVNIADIASLQMSAMDVDAGVWGVALMRLQTVMQDVIAGQNVTFLLFGNVEISDVAEEDGVVQGFYFKSGIGDSACAEVPDSGILMQTAEGVGEVSLTVNEVDIVIGSTAYLQAQPGDDMMISVVEGQAEVTSQGVTETARAGMQTHVQIDANNQPVSPPSEAEPYNIDELLALPVENLGRPVNIESIVQSSDFRTNVEDWTLSDENNEIVHNPADASSNGYVCNAVVDSESARRFQSPQAWSGDHSSAYGGNLTFALRNLSDQSSETGDITLTGGDLTLTYTLPTTPQTEWTRYIVSLIETGWLNSGTGAPATEQEIRQALTNFTALGIGATNQIDANAVACLDYVQMTRPVRSIAPYHPPRVEIPEVRTETQAASVGFQVTDGIGVAGEVDTYEFSVDDQQVVYFDGQNDITDVRWTLADSNGNTIFDNISMFSISDPGEYTLNAGDYVITVTANGDYTGTYSFQLWDVPPPQTFVIDVGTTVSPNNPASGAGTIETVGVSDIYTFNVDPGEVVYFDGESETTDILWSLLDSAGNALFADESLFTISDPGAYTLNRGGEYTIVTHARVDETGDYSFTLWDVPEPQQFEFSVGDTVTGTIESVGAVDIYTFNVEPGTSLYFSGSSENVGVRWSVYDANNNPIFEDLLLWQSADPGVFPLNLGGQYTLRVYAYQTTIGSYEFTANISEQGETQSLEAPVFTEGGIYDTIEGDIATPGEQDTYTFTAQPGQIMYFDSLNGSVDLRWNLTDEDNTSVFQGQWTRETDDPGRYVLERGGEYTITVYGQGEATGAYSVQLWNVPSTQIFETSISEFVADAQPPATIGEIQYPGEQVAYTFNVNAGQMVYFDALSGSTDLRWNLIDADDQFVFQSQWTRDSDDPGRYVLVRGGEYTLTFFGSQASIGEFQFVLWHVPETQAFEAVVSQFVADAEPPATIGEISVPGEQAMYTFTVEAGDIVYFDALSGSTDLRWNLIDADDQFVFQSQWTRDSDDPGRYVLVRGGEYTLTFFGSQTAIGEFQFVLWDVSETQTFEIPVSQFVAAAAEPPATIGEINVPGEQVMYTFAAEAGDTVYFDALSGSTDLRWNLIDADDQFIFQGQWTRDTDDPGRYILMRGGEYTLTFFGSQATIGEFQFVLWRVPETVTYDLEIGDTVSLDEPDEGAGVIAVPGEIDEYQFTADAGATLYFDSISGSTDLRWSLRDEEDNDIFNNQWTRDTDDPGEFTLERGGVYTVSVFGSQTTIGEYSIQIRRATP